MNSRPLTLALLAACSLFMVATSHDATAAPGINLSWDDCGAAGSEIKTFACDRSTGMPFTLVGSFVPPPGVNEMVGLIGEMRVSGETLPNWWEHASGSCRGPNGLSANFDFISNTTCADFMQGQAAGGFAYDIGFGAPNRARLRVIAAVPIDNKQALSPDTEYYGFKVQVLTSKTTGTLRCSGCEQPMLVQLRHVQLFQPPEAANDPIIAAPLGRTRAYWQAKTVNESVPTIASFEPQRGEVGDVVEIRGAHLSRVTHVNFSGLAFDGTSDPFSIVSDELLRATVPSGTLDGPIILDGANEFVATPIAFDVVSSEPPVIASFTPTAGAPGMIVTVTGNHFRSVTSVHLGASSVTFTVKSPTELELHVPPGALTGPIRVATSYGMATTTESFIVAPTISLVRPNEGIVGSRIELFGANLQNVSSVRFFDNVTAAFEIRSADNLIATVPANARSGPITITNPGGTHVTDVFTVVNPLAPRIDSFSPRAGAPGTEVILEGTGFIDVIRVQIVDLEASFVVNTPNRLTLTIPVNALTGPIVVTTPQGSGSTNQEFVVAPFVTSFSPSEGPPGTTVVIEGRNFTHVGRVSFDAADALFEIGNANRIVTTVPATATTGALTVASLAGVANAGIFTVHQVLSIHSFEPPGAAPGAEVLIHGAKFQDVSSVRLGELEASFSVSSSRLIRMTVPDGSLTGPIRVTTPEGTAIGPGALIVAPVITSFVPDSGGVGASIDIRGVNLENLVFVEFNSVAAPFQVLSANRIFATVPPLATTGPIRVANIGGTFETSQPFVVTSTRTLRIDRFLPASGTPGHEIIVYGNKFLDVTSVRLGPLVAQFAVYGDNELRMIVPAGAVTGKVRVQTADGSSAESQTDFIVHGDEIDGGINLSWNDCGTAGNELLTFACDSNFGLPFPLIASFKPPSGVEEFLGVSADMAITGESELPDWWKHGGGQCRSFNGLSTDFNFNSGPFSCIDVNQGHAAGGFAYDFPFDHQRARLRVQYAVPIDNRAAVDPASEYYAFKVLLLRSRTTGGGLCDGCTTPVTITLNSLQLFQPPHRAFDPILTRVIDRNSVYWQPPGDPPPTIGANLARNSTFEASNDAWKALPGTTLDRSLDAHEGQYALQAAAPDTAGEFGIHDTPNSVPSVPEVGSRYRFGAWLNPVTPGMRAQIRVREYLGTTRTQTVGSRKIGASGGWQYVEMEVAALNAGATLDFQILGWSDTPNAQLRVDDVSIRQLGAAPFVTAPLERTVTPLEPIEFVVNATSTAGGTVQSLVADFSDLPTDHNATFVAEPGNTRGVFRWTPRIDDGGGTYSVTFRGRSELEHSATTRITVSRSPDAPGMVTNPSFERLATQGWKEIQGETLELSTPGRNSASALLVRGSADSAVTFGVNDHPNIVKTTRPDALTRYRFSCWVRGDSGDGVARIRVREYLGPSKIGSASYSNDIPLTNTWRKLVVEHVPGAVGSALDFAVLCEPTQPGVAFLVDDVSVHGIAASARAERVAAQRADEVALSPPRVVPNPVRGRAMLEMALARRGPLKVELYDLNGRRVQTLFEHDDAAAGLHQFDIGGSRRGERLGPGVFFYRIASDGAVKKGRFVILE